MTWFVFLVLKSLLRTCVWQTFSGQKSFKWFMIGWRWKFGFLQFSLISQEKSLNINKLIGALFSVLQQRSEYSMLIKNTRIIQKLQRRQLGLTMTILKFFLIYLFKSTSRVVYIISYSFKSWSRSFTMNFDASFEFQHLLRW